MKKSNLFILFLACSIAACDHAEIKKNQKILRSSSLPCESQNNALSKEKRQAIADNCFKQGNYSKSSGMKW